MNKLKVFIVSAAVAIAGAAAFAPALTASALNPLETACSNSSGNTVCDEVNSGSGNLNSIIGIIVNTILFIVGALAVVMAIWSGFQYITSTGDSGKVSKAKNTLVYSIVGLIIALLAYTIVNYVFNLF